ncbi:hypothetical protein ACP3V3_02475 [Vibrio sp. PNB22_3_1]
MHLLELGTKVHLAVGITGLIHGWTVTLSGNILYQVAYLSPTQQELTIEDYPAWLITDVEPGIKSDLKVLPRPDFLNLLPGMEVKHKDKQGVLVALSYNTKGARTGTILIRSDSTKLIQVAINEITLIDTELYDKLVQRNGKKVEPELGELVRCVVNQKSGIVVSICDALPAKRVTVHHLTKDNLLLEFTSYTSFIERLDT